MGRVDGVRYDDLAPMLLNGAPKELIVPVGGFHTLHKP
jgi:hypothetical protein